MSDELMSEFPALHGTLAGLATIFSDKATFYGPKREGVTRFSTSILFIIWTPKFSFDFAKIIKFFLVNQHLIIKIFSFMTDVFTTKRISAECPFKSNQRQVKISIVTRRCAVCLRGVQLYGCGLLIPECVAHRGYCLCGVLHTTRLDSAVCNIPQR